MEGMNETSESEFGQERERLGPPWENPDAGEPLQRLWQTIIQGVKEPAELFENMRTTGGLVQPLIFYAIIIGLALIVSTLLQIPFNLILGSSFGVEIVGAIIFLILIPILLLIGLFVSSGLTHLALMVFGGANQPFEATFRVNAYAYGSIGWVFAIPFCGSLVGGVWGIVLEIIGIARVHRVSTGMAVAAVLVPVAIIFVLAMCLAMIFGAALFGALSGSF